MKLNVPIYPCLESFEFDTSKFREFKVEVYFKEDKPYLSMNFKQDDTIIEIPQLDLSNIYLDYIKAYVKPVDENFFQILSCGLNLQTLYNNEAE